MPKNVTRLKARVDEARRVAGLPPMPRKCCKAIMGMHTADCPKKGIRREKVDTGANEG